jgi:hypothetical protein
MTSDLWAHLIDDWPGAAAGVTQRGPHDPAIPWSGHNLGHTEQADHAAVDALRRRALAELCCVGRGRDWDRGRPEGPERSRRAAREPLSIVCAHQVHGRHVTVVRAADLCSQYPATDALITAEPGLALTLFYADCCPLILYCPDPLCGGVAHAGWRGSVADMAGAIVAALQREFGAPPDRLQALVGPCIGPECYEVGPEVVEAVKGLGMAQTLREYGESTHLDLQALNVALLECAGVPLRSVSPLSSCTRCGPTPLFSWRRDGPTTGRIAAIFMLR